MRALAMADASVLSRCFSGIGGISFDLTATCSAALLLIDTNIFRARASQQFSLCQMALGIRSADVFYYCSII
jgi:hypothetical protein